MAARPILCTSRPRVVASLTSPQILYFAHLATLPTPLVTSSSVVALLSVFLGVLEEPGLRASRGDECVRIIVEGLLRLGSAVEGTDGLRDGVQAYLTSRKINTELFEDKDTAGQLQDVRRR